MPSHSHIDWTGKHRDFSFCTQPAAHADAHTLRSESCKSGRALHYSRGMMTLQQALHEWRSKKRRMGCVSATHWLCSRVNGYRPERLTFYTKGGDLYQHVVATDGRVRIDLSPYACRPRE
jgi:hypothetical protein